MSPLHDSQLDKSAFLIDLNVHFQIVKYMMMLGSDRGFPIFSKQNRSIERIMDGQHVNSFRDLLTFERDATAKADFLGK